MRVAAVLPALNEAESLPFVLPPLVGHPALQRVVVADNGSTDGTWRAIVAAGAEPVWAGLRGYGSACLAALAHLAADPPVAVVFLDADGADDPADLPSLLGPLAEGAELVVGSRVRGEAERGALTPVQRFGNALACTLIDARFGVRFTDLGPFRAVTWAALGRLALTDRDFGWTVQMQARAARLGLRCVEVPVAYRRRRAGRSKVSGDLVAGAQAGAKILWTIGREAWPRG